MKKLSIVLLVLALAGGSAFAAEIALSGDATFSTSLNLGTFAGGFDANSYGLEYEFELELVPGAAGSVMGEGDTYVVFEASVDGIVLSGDDATAPAFNNPSIDVDTFKVVAGDVTIDLLGGMDSFGYASSYDFNDDDNADYDVAEGGLTGVNGGIGVEVNGLTLGTDCWYDGTTATWFVSAGYGMDLADGVALNVKAGYDNTAGFDAAAQLVYEGDLNVTLGFDAVDNFTAMDLAAQVAGEFGNVSSTLDVYYDMTDVYVALMNTIALDTIELGLDVFAETLADIDVAADFTTTVDAVKLVVDGGVTLTSWALTAWDAGAKATYSMDSADVYVDVNLASGMTLMVEVGAESSTMIDGATTSLVWASGDLLAGPADLGSITAAISVSL